MPSLETGNSLMIETPHGQREFRLLAGDVCRQPADLLMVSAHAGSGRPGGSVLRSIESRWGPLAFEDAELVLSLTGASLFRLTEGPGSRRSTAGVYRLDPPRGAPFSDLLLLRLPGARQFDWTTSVAVYRRAMRAVFAGAAALEFTGKAWPTISMPVLGGARDFDRREVMITVLSTAVDWLNVSKHTQRIFLSADQTDVESWSDAMDQALERTFDDGDYGAAVNELRTRLVEQIDTALVGAQDPALRAVLCQMREALAAQRPPSIQQFGLLGRLLAEAVSARLCADLGITPGTNTFGNIEKLAEKQSVSKWITSYLHCLRVLGNESVHLMHDEGRIPTALAAGDLVVILGNVLRVLDFCRLWTRRSSGA